MDSSVHPIKKEDMILMRAYLLHTVFTRGQIENKVNPSLKCEKERHEIVVNLSHALNL